MSERLTVESTRFGRFEVEPADVIEFPGLPGFPDARRFVLRQHDRGSVFAWLVCLDVPDLAFAVANPWIWVPDYAPRLAIPQLRALGANAADELEILAIVSASDGSLSLNLAAPLAIHATLRRGAQVILEDDRYSVRTPLPEPQIESKPQR